MSIIQDIQNRALDEGRIKAENVNSYKVLSVRPSAQLSALIEVLAFLDGKSPSEFICSHNDAGSLIYALIPQRWNRRNPKISTIGRLDVDTTGAIILTDDGALNHKLSSPKSDVSKVYEATLAVPLKGDEKEIFASGELMLNGEKKPLLPAKLEVLGETHVRLEICEGKYHQVKRMFAAVGNRVLTLHRVSFGGFTVEDLKEGSYKFIEL